MKPVSNYIGNTLHKGFNRYKFSSLDNFIKITLNLRIDGYHYYGIRDRIIPIRNTIKRELSRSKIINYSWTYTPPKKTFLQKLLKLFGYSK